MDVVIENKSKIIFTLSNLVFLKYDNTIDVNERSSANEKTINE